MPKTQVPSTGITDSAITTAKIADCAVAEAKVAGNAVTSAKITDGTVTASDLVLTKAKDQMIYMLVQATIT